MEVFNFNLRKEKSYVKQPTILLLGEFEIFHKGHEELLDLARKEKHNELIGILIIKNKQKEEFQTLENRLKLFYLQGFDFVVVVDFTHELKQTDGLNFIKKIKKDFYVKKFISGEDFYFGKDRKYNAKDIKETLKYNIKIVPLLKYNNKKIGTTDIKQMHEFGEYNVINLLVSSPLVFDVELISSKIHWIQNCVKPHYGIYYFKILIDNFWYSGLIRFSIDNCIEYYLVNYNSEKPIFDQKTQIKICNINRIITNSRFDKINDDDKLRAKKTFSIN